jgi:hypothetical protein
LVQTKTKSRFQSIVFIAKNAVFKVTINPSSPTESLEYKKTLTIFSFRDS